MEPKERLRLTIMTMAGDCIATLKVKPESKVKDLANALGKAAGADDVPLVLALRNKLLEYEDTMKRAGVHDGDEIIVVRYPELFVSAAFEDGSTRLYSSETSEVQRAFDSDHPGVLSVTITPSGHNVLLGCMDGSCNVWTIASGEFQQKFFGHRGPLSAVCCSPDEKLLATGSFDRCASVWNRANGKCIRQCRGHRTTVNAIAFSHDGNILASGSEDGAVFIWGIFDGTQSALTGHEGGITSIYFSPTGEFLVTGSLDKMAIIWSVDSEFEPVRMVKEHNCGVTAVCLTDDDTLLGVGYLDGIAKVFDVGTGKCTMVLKGHQLTYKLRCLAFSPGGALLATGSDDGTMRLWSLTTGICKDILEGPVSRTTRRVAGVRSIAFVNGIPGQTVMASGVPRPPGEQTEEEQKAIQDMARQISGTSGSKG